MKFRKKKKKDIYQMLQEVAAVCIGIGILQLAGAEEMTKTTETIAWVRMVCGLVEVILGCVAYKMLRKMHAIEIRKMRKKEREMERRVREREFQKDA